MFVCNAAQRIGVQLPQARCSGIYQKTGDLAREAVNCNAGFGRAVLSRSKLHAERPLLCSWRGRVLLYQSI